MHKNLRNHRKPWNSSDQVKIEDLVKRIENREDLETITSEMSSKFERTPSAIAKRINALKHDMIVVQDIYLLC